MFSVRIFQMCLVINFFPYFYNPILLEDNSLMGKFVTFMIQKCITTQIIVLDTYPLQSKPLIKRTGSHLKIKIGSHHLLTSIYCLVTKDKTPPPSGTFTPPSWYRSSLSLIITNPPFLILVSSPNLRWLR